MAKKSKPSKSNDKSLDPDDFDTAETTEYETQEASESSGDDAPVVIEGEAVEVTEEDSEEQVEATDNDPNDNQPLPEPAIAQAEQSSGSSFWPLLLGGIVAGGIGYLVAAYGTFAPDTTEVTQGLAENSERIEALATEVASLEEQPAEVVDLSGIENSIADIASRFDSFETEIASVRDAVADAVIGFDETASTLEDRLTVLETAGPGGTAGAAATEEELSAFRAQLETMTAEAEARVAAAQAKAAEVEETAAATAAAAEQAAAEAERIAAEAQASAERDAAIVELKAALESGGEYASVLPTIGDVPEVLAANAETGVTTMLALQQAFPDVARKALAVAQTTPQDASTGERLTAFLKRQTNARSLTPKDGDGADAVLSRAEDMLKQGDLPAALAEIDLLPDEAQTAMQGWLTDARTRLDAIDAAAELSATN